jgi:hypothetical protein
VPMEEDLVARLAGVAPIAAIFDSRISWFELPRAAGLPAIMLTMVYPGEDWTHQGPMALTAPRVQFDVWGLDDTTVATGARLIKAEMQRLDAVTVGDTEFLPPAILELSQPSKDQIGGTESVPGLPVYRWLLDMSFSCQPAT